MIGQISSTLITATAIIIVARFLGSTNYGQITIAMIPISIAGLFIDLGINGALIKYLAQYRSQGRNIEENSFLKAARAPSYSSPPNTWPTRSSINPKSEY